MKTWVLVAFVLVLAAVAMAIPRPELPPQLRAIAEEPVRAPIRTARADEEPKKDLEGSESGYIAYPYIYPYWSHYPYVVVGK